LLVATVLSAQTTDRAVNQVTPGLFAAYPDAQAMAAASPEAIGERIRSLGLWRNKAKHLHALSQQLAAANAGAVPRTLKALTALPGVGRKTATAVLGQAFNDPVGLTVDTHMLRINRLVGLSTARTATRMARELEALLPRECWVAYTHRIIDHGRAVCVAKRPRCGKCPINDLCAGAYHASAGYRPANDTREPASARNVSWRARERSG